MANTERENIEKVQKLLALIKECNAEEIDRWMKEGNAERMNAWYTFDAKLRLTHAEATKDLTTLFPEHSGVVTRGGGGGR